MASLSKTMLIGNVGKKPETRMLAGGQSVTNFPVATSEKFKDAAGVEQERTEWHSIVVWGRQGENCEKYLDKGRQVYVEGSLRTRSYDDKEGNKRYATELIARVVHFLGGGNGGGEKAVASQPTAPSQGASGESFDDLDSESPF